MSSLRLAIKQSLEGSGSTIESEQPTTSSSRPRPRISISLKPNSRIGSIPNTNANRQRQQQQQQRRRQQQQQQQPSLNTISIVMANNKNNQQQQRRKQQKLAAPSATRRQKNAVVVKLPEITKCIRNSDPTLIDEFGFVEIRNALPSILIEQIYREAADKVTNLNQRSNNANSSNNTNRSSGRKRNSPSSSPSSRGGGEGTTTTTSTTTTTTTNEVEEISNALQTDVSEELFRKVKMAMEDCDIAKRTMVTVFGKKGPPTTSPSSSSSSNNDDDDDDSCSSSIHPTNRTESNYKGYVLETPKVLITPPGSPPQLPHADDHCSSCVFCLIHLRDGQEPTRVARYREEEDVDGKKKEKDYPTGITVGCDRCNRTEQLPDKDFRRGVHLTNEKWHCNCTSPHTPYDFEHKLTESFSELLSENAPNLCDAYAGPPSPHQSSGDGFLGLPTLIHRGPGNPTSATESRFVLFLTLRPLYDNMKQMEKGQVSVDKLHHHYNPALQIHASCMLYNQFKKVNSIYERAGCGLDGYFGAIVGAETASLMSEVKRLKEENRKLKEKIVSVRKKHSRSGRDFDGDWTIDGGG